MGVGSSETINNGTVDGAPGNLEYVPCNNEEGLQQFRVGKWVALRVDLEWIDPSSRGHPAPMGCVGWPHPDNYRIPQFLDAIQSGHNIMAFWDLGTPHLAICSFVAPPLPKGEATYNQRPLRSEVCDSATRRKSSDRV